MLEKKVSDKFLRHFVPEHSNAVQIFSLFPYTPLKSNKYFLRGIKSTNEHLEKFKVLAEIGNDLFQGFDIDRQQLQENGYSPANYSRKYAAIIECCINELYASLDGIRDVLYFIYADVQGMQKKSTSKLFTKAKKNQYGNGFPLEVLSWLSEAHDHWFLELRRYRTEFTHGSLGSCSKDDETNKVSYMHVGLGSENRALIIDDFVSYTNDVYSNIIELQNNIFSYLYQSLNSDLEPSKVLCGLYLGRAYMREITPEKVLTFNSGTCESTHYDVACPMSESCGAYKQAKTKT